MPDSKVMNPWPFGAVHSNTMIDMVNARINLPFGLGLYCPFTVMLGMV